MSLSIFASLGVDIVVIGGITFFVFFMLFIISWLSCLIKKYIINRKVERQVLPRRNVSTRACTTVATHRSQAIVPEPREPPKRTNAASGASISASTYHESKRVRSHTTVATHGSQAIIPESCKPPKKTNAATGASISASTYHESKRVRAHTTVATHRSQAIIPEPREPPKRTNAATGALISASTYQESERVETCVSCVCPLRKGDMVLRLPACDHLLHDFCIGPWFFVNSVCPGCGEQVNGQLTVRVGNGRTV